MQRREFITLLGGAALVLGSPARAQQRPVIGFLSSASADPEQPRVRAFRQGLGEAGYVAGHNVEIEYRWADGHNERLAALAADLVRRGVAVLVTDGASPAAQAAKAATATVPSVFQIGADPVAIRLVASLNRPGGNLTGVTSLNTELTPKRLDVLHELLPGATVIAALHNATNPNTKLSAQEQEAAARTLGIELRYVHASTEHELDEALATVVGLEARGLMLNPDPLFAAYSEKLAALALRHRVPTISPYPEFPVAGGLMSYGASITDQLRLMGRYAGRILNGEKPADLPVQQATKVELIINLKTAKALGIAFPTALLVRADEVIE